MLLIEKNGIGWHHQVHTGALNILEGLNGTGEFALHSTLIIHFLIEFGLAPGALVEEFESHASTVQVLAGRHLHARRIQLVCRNADGFPVGADLVRNTLLTERGCQGLGVGRFQPCR